MKPPVVVVERHCKTNQCWIAVRFKKIPSVAKISQNPEASAREEVRANEFHSGIAGNVYFPHACARHHRKFFRLALAVCLALVTIETVSARPKKAARRASRRAADRSFRPADGSATEPAFPFYKPHRRSTARATASPIACTRFPSMPASATTPPSRLLRALLA